jgi:integrase/recombinase XerD
VAPNVAGSIPVSHPTPQKDNKNARFYGLLQPCYNLGVAKVYIRRKEPGKGWRYRAVPKTGRPPQIAPGVKFHVRYRDAGGKFVWSQPYDSLEEARQEAAGLELNAKAVALGLTVEEYKDSKNAHRTRIKSAIEHFVSDVKKTKKRTTAAEYERNLKQFENSPKIQKIRFVDEITKRTLCDFRDFLASEGYQPRTLHNRLLLVLILLKANGIKTDFSLVRDLPEYEEEAAVPYEPAELKTLFAEMDEEETVRYKFFLGTACREQEVMYASWQDVDFARGVYHIRAKPDVGFTPKKHESRDVKMPTELVEMLRKRKKHAPHQRWIFINGGGKPEGHFLEKLKRIALRAKVNCGHCTAPWTEGRYPTRKIEVTCTTHPVCQHHYLHRLRKTCASNWEAKHVPVRTIQYMLGHKSLETTQKYLGITNLDSLTDKIDAAAVIV